METAKKTAKTVGKMVAKGKQKVEEKAEEYKVKEKVKATAGKAIKAAGMDKETAKIAAVGTGAMVATATAVSAIPTIMTAGAAAVAGRSSWVMAKEKYPEAAEK